MLNNLFADRNQPRTAAPYPYKPVSAIPTQETANPQSQLFGTQNFQARRQPASLETDFGFSSIAFPTEIFSNNATQQSQLGRTQEQRPSTNQQKLMQLYQQLKRQFEASCNVFLGKLSSQADNQGLIKKEANPEDIKTFCTAIKESFNDKMAYYKKKKEREAQRRAELVKRIESHLHEIDAKMDGFVQQVSLSCRPSGKPKRINNKTLKETIVILEEENKELNAKLDKLRQKERRSGDKLSQNNSELTR
jgi:hypothetical protein